MAERKVSKRRKLARERTDWALERTLLASERTFAAWIRTALAALAVGLAVGRFLNQGEPRTLVIGISALLVVLSLASVAFGFKSYRATLEHVEEDAQPPLPVWLIGVFALMFAVVAVGGLWMIVQK